LSLTLQAFDRYDSGDAVSVVVINQPLKVTPWQLDSSQGNAWGGISLGGGWMSGTTRLVWFVRGTWSCSGTVQCPQQFVVSCHENYG
jgi:hypothetical protein